MKENTRDEYDEGVIIPFPDTRADRPNLGPLCDGCRKNNHPRNEGRGKCGHAVFFSGFSFCCRCAITKMVCRCCGCDIANVFRQAGQKGEHRGQRKRGDEKSKMKILKR